jgi:hypothetical protein
LANEKRSSQLYPNEQQEYGISLTLCNANTWKVKKMKNYERAELNFKKNVLRERDVIE